LILDGEHKMHWAARRSGNAEFSHILLVRLGRTMRFDSVRNIMWAFGHFNGCKSTGDQPT
jgi:hypothetical protein